MQPIRVTVWNENIHEQSMPEMKALYPDGLHGTIAKALTEDARARFTVRTATLDQPEQGLPDAVLAETDVLFWWGHAGHDRVEDSLVERIYDRVMNGMGIVVLHSGHYSKIFKRLTGTGCRSKWWEKGDRERVFVVEPGHPIAQGIPEFFELEHEETYCEHFNIPAPDELVFLGWFSGGGVLRSGCCYRRGAGKLFYFQPGHETHASFLNPHIRQILRNAAAWAAPTVQAAPVYGQFDPMESKEA